MTQPIWNDDLKGGIGFGQTPDDVAQFYKGRAVYLATPYSKIAVDILGAWSYEFSHHAARQAAIAANGLRARDVSAFSPIVQAAAQVHATGTYVVEGTKGMRFFPLIDPLDGDLWMRWCLPFLDVCAAVVVPDIKGWQDSVGIAAEVRRALDDSKPVFVYAVRA